MADHGDKVARAARLHAQYAAADFRIVEGNAFHQPRQHFFAGAGATEVWVPDIS